MFSESPSPARDLSTSFLEDWRSCPELDQDRAENFSDLSQRESEIGHIENMEKNFSKSAHTLKVSMINFLSYEFKKIYIFYCSPLLLYSRL